jgi:hypothetical protein
MRRIRMVDMCKSKRKLWLRGTDDVLVVELHMVGKIVKVSSLNNVPSFLALYFSFTWFIPLISFLPLLFSLFILFLSFFHTHIFFSFFTFLLLFFSFFSILILLSLFFPLLTSFQSSQLLPFLHAYNLKF